MSSMASRASDKEAECVDAHRAAAEVVGDAGEIAMVEGIQPAVVHVEAAQRRIGGGAVDGRGAGHGGKVAHPAQQPPGDAGVPREPLGDLARAILRDADLHDPRAALHDLESSSSA